MKIILAGILCLFFAAGGAAQEAGAGETDSAPVTVERILLLRDDGAGRAGEETENFSTSDKTLHFRIELGSRKSAVIKMILVAADVAGLKPETKSVTVNYKTSGKQNIVNFTAAPEDAWLSGKYRADIYIDGKPANKREFEIRKPPPKIAAENQTAPPTASPKPKMNPEIGKRKRKN